MNDFEAIDVYDPLLSDNSKEDVSLQPERFVSIKDCRIYIGKSDSDIRIILGNKSRYSERNDQVIQTAAANFYNIVKNDKFTLQYYDRQVAALSYIIGHLFSINTFRGGGYVYFHASVKLYSDDSELLHNMLRDGYFYFTGNLEYEECGVDGKNINIISAKIDTLHYIQEGKSSQELLPNPPF